MLLMVCSAVALPTSKDEQALSDDLEELTEAIKEAKQVGNLSPIRHATSHQASRFVKVNEAGELKLERGPEKSMGIDNGGWQKMELTIGGVTKKGLTVLVEDAKLGSGSFKTTWKGAPCMLQMGTTGVRRAVVACVTVRGRFAGGLLHIASPKRARTEHWNESSSFHHVTGRIDGDPFGEGRAVAVSEAEIRSERELAQALKEGEVQRKLSLVAGSKQATRPVLPRSAPTSPPPLAPCALLPPSAFRGNSTPSLHSADTKRRTTLQAYSCWPSLI